MGFVGCQFSFAPVEKTTFIAMEEFHDSLCLFEYYKNNLNIVVHGKNLRVWFGHVSLSDVVTTCSSRELSSPTKLYRL